MWVWEGSSAGSGSGGGITEDWQNKHPSPSKERVVAEQPGEVLMAIVSPSSVAFHDTFSRPGEGPVFSVTLP